MLPFSMLSLAASALAAAPTAELTFPDGSVGPFSLNPSAPQLAVVEGSCDAGGAERLHLYALPALDQPVWTVPLGEGCVESLLWTAGDGLVLRRRLGKGVAVELRDAETGSRRLDLGTRPRWGGLRLNADGSLLAEVTTEKTETGTWRIRSTFRKLADGAIDHTSEIELEGADRPPTMIDHGLGVLHHADGRFWQYDLIEGRLITSRPAPPEEPGEVLRLIDAAAPGGESRIYVANDFQSGFDKPLPPLWGTKLPKHVFSVPELKVLCRVEGVDTLRDFTAGILGSGFSARPGDEPRPLYQRATPGGPLLAFLMPPKDPFVNPFGAGQTAYVIRQAEEGVCTAAEVAELGREAFAFDASAEWLVVSTARDPSTPVFRGLALYAIE